MNTALVLGAGAVLGALGATVTFVWVMRDVYR